MIKLIVDFIQKKYYLCSLLLKNGLEYKKRNIILYFLFLLFLKTDSKEEKTRQEVYLSRYKCCNCRHFHQHTRTVGTNFPTGLFYIYIINNNNNFVNNIHLQTPEILDIGGCSKANFLQLPGH